MSSKKSVVEKSVVEIFGSGKNIIALQDEIKKLESLNFKVVNSSGYGVGAYNVNSINRDNLPSLQRLRQDVVCVAKNRIYEF